MPVGETTVTALLLISQLDGAVMEIRLLVLNIQRLVPVNRTPPPFWLNARQLVLQPRSPTICGWVASPTGFYHQKMNWIRCISVEQSLVFLLAAIGVLLRTAATTHFTCILPLALRFKGKKITYTIFVPCGLFL